MKRPPQLPNKAAAQQAPKTVSSLFYELSSLKNYFHTNEHKKHSSWGIFTNDLLKKSSELTQDIHRLMDEAQGKKKVAEKMEYVKEGMLQMIKEKQIELFGREAQSKEEQILQISDPV